MLVLFPIEIYISYTRRRGEAGSSFSLSLSLSLSLSKKSVRYPPRSSDFPSLGIPNVLVNLGYSQDYNR